MRRLAALAGTLLLLAGTASGEPLADGIAPAAPGATGTACETLFRDDDPRLFDFIESRRAVDFRRYQGLRIRDVRFLRLPVFNEHDSAENGPVYRLVNRIHTDTREKPIRKQVLFAAGETVDDDRIRQTERILRGNKYLYDAMVLPGEVCADGIDLLVVTRDIWTLQPTANFKHSGGETSTALGLSDDNILGSGNSLTLMYKHSADRDGRVLTFNNDHAWDGHTAVHAGIEDNTDGQVKEFSIQRPFFAMDTAHAGGVSHMSESRRDEITRSGIPVNDYAHRTTLDEAWFGALANTRGNVVHRWRFGITRDVNRFYDQDPAYALQPLPEERNLTWPWAQIESVENHYVTTANHDQMFRNEDVLLGRAWSLRTGITSRGLGSTEDAFLARWHWQHTLSFDTGHLLQSQLDADVEWNASAGRFENTRYGYQARYERLIDERNRWSVALDLALGDNLSEDEQLTAGGETGLRGFPNDWQRGDRRAVVNIERRHYFLAHPLRLFRLGAAAFIDVGKAWDSAGQIVQSDRVLADVGVGLRVNSSKARPNHVMHLNFAFPVTDRAEAGSFQWSVYAGETF